jgi:hypothetical protein
MLALRHALKAALARSNMVSSFDTPIVTALVAWPSTQPHLP